MTEKPQPAPPTPLQEHFSIIHISTVHGNDIPTAYDRKSGEKGERKAVRGGGVVRL